MGLAANQVYVEDCVQGLARIAPGTIDLAFADPPFNIGYDYDVYQDRRASEEYLGWTRRWMSGVARALKPNGTFWLAIGDEYAAELKLIAQGHAGFACRSWVIWYYTFGVNCTRAFSRSHTHLFHFVKDPKNFTFNADNPAIRVPSARQLVYADGRANPRGRLPDNTWILRPQDVPGGFAADHDTWYFPRVAGTFKEREGFHGCQMPEQLLARIIRSCSNPLEIVLDPFGGSGTTFAVAKKLGRQWMGFELSQDYVKRIRARLDKARAGDPLDGVADPLSSVPATFAGTRNPKKGLPGRTSIAGPKIARRLPSFTRDRDFEKGIISAYKSAHKGYSVDCVLATTDLDAAFVDRCKRSGLLGAPADWNRALLRIRKAGKLPRLEKRAPTFSLREMDAYSFASEVALQHLSVEFGTTLDGILCDPQLAARFDEVAGAFSPGFTPFQYRWAALSLRKRAKDARKLARDRYLDWLTRRLPPRRPVSEVDLTKYERPGVYLLASRAVSYLYVGGTLNLRRRIEQTCQIASWKNLEPFYVNLIPVHREGNEPLGLQSVLIRRMNPLMNCRLLGLSLEA